MLHRLNAFLSRHRRDKFLIRDEDRHELSGIFHPLLQMDRAVEIGFDEIDGGDVVVEGGALDQSVEFGEDGP
jgi:hypothetical protein